MVARWLCAVSIEADGRPFFFFSLSLFANRGLFILFVAVFTGVERCDHVTFKDTDTAKTVSPVWLNRGLDRSNLMRSDLSVFNVLAATRYTAETDWLNQGEGSFQPCGCMRATDHPL